MPEKDPTTYSLLTYAWVFALSAWGGVVSMIRKIRSGESKPHNLMEFVGEIVTSGFAGALTFLGCQAAGFDLMWTAVLVGVSGHMGARAIYQVERVAMRIFEHKIGS